MDDGTEVIGALLQQFIDRYRRAGTGITGADPDAAALLDIEDELADIISFLTLLSLSDTEKEDLRGKRIPEAPDLMYEVAEALRECPEVQAAVPFGPEFLSRIADQDLALGGVALSLWTVYRRADTGSLTMSDRGESALDEIERAVKKAIASAGTLFRRESIDAIFADPMDRLDRARHKARAPRKNQGPAPAADPQDEAAGQKDQALPVKDLSPAELEGLVRQLVQAALSPRRGGRPT